jgi:NAD(P)-dependent dehydrogenase (short-subunit alcohol dehydrogenase family)
MRALITGGAGFIGSHLAQRLLEQGDRVRALDALLPQVHGDGSRPPYLAEDVELVVGDVRSPDVVRKALVGVEATSRQALVEMQRLLGVLRLEAETRGSLARRRAWPGSTAHTVVRPDRTRRHPRPRDARRASPRA